MTATPRFTWRRGVLALLASACVALGACKPAATPSSAADSGIARTAEKGDVRLTVRADRTAVEVGEPIRLEIEVSGSAAIAPPVLEKTLGAFDVRPAPKPVGPAPADAAAPSSRTAVYELTTLDSGDVEIPAISLPLGEGADAPTLATEPIPVKVTSLIGESQNPKDFRDIKGVVDLPQPFDALRLATVAAIGLGATLTILWLVFMLRRTGRLDVMLPADQRAMRELADLEAKRLPAAGRMHEFYVEVTDIVRVYIERRFGLRAPELTTPEFLREARRASAISDEHQKLLGGFLRGADLVKFGGVQPTVSQCDDALGLARRFVGESAPVADATAAPRSTLQDRQEVPA
jgi:hypothetical protein